MYRYPLMVAICSTDNDVNGAATYERRNPATILQAAVSHYNDESYSN